jgi:hypothetical protein
MLFADNTQRHIYIYTRMHIYNGSFNHPTPLLPVLALTCPLLFDLTPLFTYLENQLLLLVVQIPIHSCPWFAINCSPLAASPTPRHPTDQVTYLHRRHQQHRLSHPTQVPTDARTIQAIYMFLYCNCKTRMRSIFRSVHTVD